jgi:hypothetical protein
VAFILIRHDDVVPMLGIVGEFVDGVGHGIGFDGHEKRRVRAADLQEPGFAEPIARVENGDVGEFLAVQLASGSDGAHCFSSFKKSCC